MANIADLTARIEHAVAVLKDATAAEAQVAKLSSDLQAAQEALTTQASDFQAQIDQMSALLPPADPAPVADPSAAPAA